MLTRVIVTAVYVLAAGHGTIQTGSVAMEDLTIPSERLPAACVFAKHSAGLGIPANPWLGTDAAVIGRIAETIEPMQIPDAPPLTVREQARMRLRLADGIEDGYSAVYEQEPAVSGSRFTVTVYALRYSDPTKAARTGTRWLKDTRVSRTVIGSVVVFVVGDGGPCFTAVAAHVQTLARP